VTLVIREDVLESFDNYWSPIEGIGSLPQGYRPLPEEARWLFGMR
jgi:hypothetical protein